MPEKELFAISQVHLEEEMKRSYLDYAMSVIVSRALPDARDGLKPVHRRILYSMKESGLDYNRPYRKSARVVGDVMGKYHPHGDLAIYNAMVRMAQPFSLRVPLVDGQGNFGSMDGDPAAAMRYTEARLSHPAHYLIEDIDKATVDFQPNYDESTTEPVVLPAQFPNLLVNGAGGIAVGMATNIPPHNLGEVIEGCCAYVDNPEITVEELIQYIPGPDFPTGAQIVGQEGIYKAYQTGNGSILMRAKSHFEQVGKDREAIIFTEVPYQANKSRLMERIAELVNDKTIEGISDLRDESDREGVRMVVELKRDVDANVILNQLHKYTPLQDSFGANMLALDGGRPLLMNLKEMIAAFVKFREEVIVRRARFELEKAREKGHIFVGLALAVANIDAIIELIREATDPNIAKEALMSRDWPVQTMGSVIRLIEIPKEGEEEKTTYQLSEKQAKSILDLRLHRLTGLERDKIIEELSDLVKEIERYIFILSNRSEVLRILKEELMNIKNKFATPRRSEIIEGDITTDIEHLIQKEDMVVTVSHTGYIKRVPLSTYRAQRRGGRGRSGMQTRDEDFVEQLFVANTHTPILFFSSLGKAYVLKVYRLPIATATSKGKALINILPLEKNEKISTIMPLSANEDQWDNLQIIFATSKGNIRKNKLSDFLNIRANGKIAMKLEEEGEYLVSVATCEPHQDILLSTHAGKCIRFRSTDVRVFASRNSTGVRGIRLQKDDYVVSMCILNHGPFSTEERDLYIRQSRAMRHETEAEGGTETEASSEPIGARLSEEKFQAMATQEEFLLTISEKGMGKRTSSYEYRLTGRGGQGITNMDITDKTGLIVACFPVTETDHLMLITDAGQMIRSRVAEIRIAGRRTQGVRVFRLATDEKVVSAERIFDEEDDGSDNEEISTDVPNTFDSLN
jgi:DNA gyrase subunit A